MSTSSASRDSKLSLASRTQSLGKAQLQDGFTAFAFLSDGRPVVAEDSPGRVGIYQSDTSRVREVRWQRLTLPGVPRLEIESLAVDEREPALALGLEDGGVAYWPSLEGPPLITPMDGEARVVVISPTGRLIAASSQKRTLIIEVTDEGLLPTGLALVPGGALAFSRDEKTLFIAGRTVEGYDLATGEPVMRMDAKENVSSLAVDPTGRWLAIGMLGGQVLVAPLDASDLLTAASKVIDAR